MKTLRSLLSILLVVLFIPSPALLVNSAEGSGMAAAMRARNAAASAGAGVPSGAGGGGAGGSTSAGAHASAEAHAAHNRARMSMEAMKRMQEAARLHSGAIADRNRPGHFLPDVPNGLGSGGLQVADGIEGNPSLWQGAQLPGQQQQDGKTIVTVRQEAAQALLTWQSFNVGRETVLNFDQSAGGADSDNWTVFNRVVDAGASPSQILGSITAEGQVYVINPNGVIFGNNSSVDVRGLAVSSLPVNQHLVENGLLNNPDSQFLFSGVAMPVGANGSPAFTPEPPPAELGRYGDVLVMAGAQLRSTLSEDGNGGRILLAAPNVENHGTISTPGGQAILAAGLQVGIAPHSASDASLRGLDVYVGAVDANSGHALNAGLIEAPLGNATMVGKRVEVTGGIDSSTSVALNGRIDLIAAYGATSNPLSAGTQASGNYQPFLNQQSGTVLIGEDSVLQILPEIDSDEKVAATELALRSQLNFSGRDIYFGERSTVLAPSGIINANAGVWKVRQAGGNRIAELINADGQIYLDKDALIYAAGTTDVEIPLSQVLLEVELRGSELADSPVQRDDVLRGETIVVDIRKQGTLNGEDWVGSPLADVSGYLGLIERTVAELTLAGGEVNLNAGGAIVMREGATVDVSGGFARYAGGTVETTALLKDGRVIDIADALPEVSYDGIYDTSVESVSERWGAGDSYSKPYPIRGASYESAYTEGAAGGSLALTASAMALDGTLRGSTVVGERQRTNVPEHAKLTLAFETRDTSIAPSRTFPVISPNAPDITFTNEIITTGAIADFVAGQGASAVSAQRTEQVALAADLLGSDGFGSVAVRNREGGITVGQGVALNGQTGGALTLEGANITVDGSIRIAGGTIDLSAYNVSYTTINALDLLPNPVNPQPQSGRGIVTLGTGAVLSTAGQIVVDTAENAGLEQGTYAVEGGTVSLRGFETRVEGGSIIDVSGGAHLSAGGKLTYGNGGAIVLEGGRDPIVRSVLGGSLLLEGDLLGYSGARGAALNLLAPVVQIGGQNTATNALNLDSEFFSEGGFSDFTVRGIGATAGGQDNFVAGVTIAADAAINPQVTSLLAVREGDTLRMDKVQLEEGVRAPGSLTFGAVGADDAYARQLLVRGEVKMEEGAKIETDAGGRVTFNANVVELHGTVVTPGGTIEVNGGSSYNQVAQNDARALPTVLLGQSAQLIAAGKTVYVPNAQGLRSGTVHGGGSIGLSGNIVTEAGALLDVSGTSGVLDLPNTYSPISAAAKDGTAFRSHTPVQIETSGGTISLAGSELLVSDATLVGNAGGEGAAGGTLKVSSGRFYRSNETRTSADVTLTVRQSGEQLGQGAIGQGVVGADGQSISGGGYFTADSFAAGGFDNLELGGNVGFDEAVTIDARGSVRIAEGGVLQSSAHPVTIRAAHVAIGQDFSTPLDPSQRLYLFTKDVVNEPAGAEHTFTPVSGEGTLRVEADSIDIGTLVLQGIHNAQFVADESGSIRGNGSLNIAGELTLEGGQIHPTTATEFSITAFDYNRGGQAQQGIITFSGGNASLQLPYSAGGTLSAYASQIRQEGVLRSPFGVINLGWDGTGQAPRNAVSGAAVPSASRVELGQGSVTSVSAIGPDGKGLTLPYGVLLNGISWIDPRGVDITLGGLPEKQVNLSAADVVTEDGSLIDLRGGGDLFAYRWVPGVGGSRDILAGGEGFAVMPGYSAAAPSAPYNPNSIDNTLGGDKGYADERFKVGDQIYLSAESGLPAGYYTLLPARYALLEGAYLVTPKSGTPIGNNTAITLADGSRIVSGYRVDGLTGKALEGEVLSLFEVAGRDVVLQRAQYDIYSANEFMAQAAADRDMAAPRLPQDSGQLVFTAAQSMRLEGGLLADAMDGGRGSLVDINSALDIVIGGSGAAGADVLHLDTQTLNAFNAASLLIGGVRSSEGNDTVVQANSGTVTLDNAGVPLVGTDIILVGKDMVRLAEGAQIIAIEPQQGTARAEAIRIGDAQQAGSGDGAVVRVSADSGAVVERVGVSEGNSAQLRVQAGAQIGGSAVTLDSSSQTQIDQQAQLDAGALNLGSGRISLVLGEAVPTDGGLVLSGDVLESIFASTQSLGLSSYSSIDVYGSGNIGSDSVRELSLNAPSLRAFATDGGQVEFVADHLRVQNTTGTTGVSDALPRNGTLRLNAETLSLGKGVVAVDGFNETVLGGGQAVRLSGKGGLRTQGDLRVVTPVLLGDTAADHTLYAGGVFTLEQAFSAAQSATITPGVGSSLSIEGQRVDLHSNIVMPAGKVAVRARSGDIILGEAGSVMSVDVSSSSRDFYDKASVTDGGSVTLVADQGNVSIGNGASVDVSATGAGAKAGKVAVSVAEGAFTLEGQLLGGDSGTASFELDAGQLGTATAGELGWLDAALNEGNFGGSRTYRLRGGDVVVDGLAKARHYSVSADGGSVLVSGMIDASGFTGGQIELRAASDLVLAEGSVLTVAAEDFSNAGKGGKVFLEAGSQIDGQVNHDGRVRIGEGSLIDLSVATHTADSAAKGQHSGVLHLRAAQNEVASDLGIDPIEGEIRNASHIVAEGYRLYDLTDSAGVINQTVRNAVYNDGVRFLGAGGSKSDHYDAMLARLSGGDATLAEQIVLQTGAEIINRNGDLTLGSAGASAPVDWDLSTYRFGPRSAAGVLTLRATGNIGVYDAVSDGFAKNTSLWLAPLMAQNTLLPTNAQSWSYRFSAGADTSAANYRTLLNADELAAGKGSLLLGKNALDAAGSGSNATTASIINNRFQVIRTGSGDIDIAAAGDVRFLNPFAAIYTAGTAVADATSIHTQGDFSVPVAQPANLAFYQNNLGAAQQVYRAQYSLSGGDVSIHAGGDIGRYTYDNSGRELIDTSRQMPTNWLHRRGYVDNTGNYGRILLTRFAARLDDPAASTTWWVDFSNFFQSVGALGGGNVSLSAGRDIINVDAVVPTNARAPMGVPDAAKILELGGGDLQVQAGRNIDGGIYYVERGEGALHAGGVVTTNAARSINRNIVGSLSNPEYLPEQTWMPTTLFLGKGSFDVSAMGDVLLGPVANVFMMPQGFGNGYWYKTYFSTYAPQSELSVRSVAGDITMRSEVTMVDSPGAQSFLGAWLSRQNLQALTGSNNAAYYQPWLRLAETSVEPFGTQFTVMPPTLRLDAHSGDVNLSGSFNLFPSHIGTVEVLAAGNIHALSINGVSDRIIRDQRVNSWNTSRINLSDANPNLLPGVASPLSYYGIVGADLNTNAGTAISFLQGVSRFFVETGATNSVLQTKQALHAAELLHRNDKEPIYLYAAEGDIAGLTLYSAKPARIIASRDIADIAFYLQNLNAQQISLVAAGRDIVAYHANSDRRLLATSQGNAFNTGLQAALGGDIQLSGPGTLQVLAGRNLDLGVGPSGANGLSSGVTTIGNRRNPFLPEQGADIIAGAGIGLAQGIENSDLDFPAFIATFLNPQTGGELAGRYLKELGKLMHVGEGEDVWAAFNDLKQSDQGLFALGVFYMVLRDAGRDYNNPEAVTFGTYDNGIAAIKALFPQHEQADGMLAHDGDDEPEEETSRWAGNISLTSRQFKTQAGGDISLFAPGGGLVVGFPVANARADQGVLTEAGGDIRIFTHGSVEVGSSRIFTLRGGDIAIWSSTGDIAAGSAAKTVRSAPPTRVVIDSQTASVLTDLSGLATGGGIGALQTVKGAAESDIDLIAPEGSVDAGDAGIRVSGNVNIAAVEVVNAGNIASGGTSTGVPPTVAAMPNMGGIAAAAAAAQAATSGVGDVGGASSRNTLSERSIPSIISIEVLGYGEEEDKRNSARLEPTQEPAPSASYLTGMNYSVDGTILR